jgi:glycosyltransferase involved in cell wall biosynthesis
MSDLSALVSISCITFIHAPFIRKCLDGFLAQKTDFPFEIVIYDDASTDGTVSVVEEYIDKYPGLFKPFFNSENQYSKGIRGMNMRFNFPRCEGKYIAFCEGDDFWTDPYKLQKQVDFLEKNPNFSISCTNYSQVNTAAEVTCENVWGGPRLSPVIPQKTILEVYIPKILTSVFRNEAIKDGMPEVFYKVFNTDNFLCAIATSYGPAGFMNINTGSYRVHNKGIWSSKGSIMRYQKQLETFQLMSEFFTGADQKQAISKRIYGIRRGLSKIYYKEKMYSESFAQLHILFQSNKLDSFKVLAGNLLSPLR